MWANAQRDGRPAEYRWRPVLKAAKFDLRPLLECRAVTLPIAERKTWRTQSEFCTWQNSVVGQPPKMYTVSQKRPTLTCYNLHIHGSIATSFGINVAKKVGNQRVLYFPTSPN